MDSLQKAKVTSSEVYLVCIEEELEAWLLADDRPLKALFQKLINPHPLKKTIKAKKKPETVRNPKAKLTQIFKEVTGYKYVDMKHAKMIVEKLENFNKLKHSTTFVRFALKATEIQL
ncbi:MAG: hypothetical protein AB4426_11045 [Xenococcaceae cyanobacterium]